MLAHTRALQKSIVITHTHTNKPRIYFNATIECRRKRFVQTCTKNMTSTLKHDRYIIPQQTQHIMLRRAKAIRNILVPWHIITTRVMSDLSNLGIFCLTASHYCSPKLIRRTPTRTTSHHFPSIRFYTVITFDQKKKFSTHTFAIIMLQTFK